MRVLFSAIAIAFTVNTSPVLAHECGSAGGSCSGWDLKGSWYSGGLIGYQTANDWGFLNVNHDGSLTFGKSDDSGLAMKIFFGLDFRNFAVELGYTEGPEVKNAAQSDGSGFFWSAGPVRESNKLRGYDASVLGKYHFSNFLVGYLRLGAIQLRQRHTISGTSQSVGYFELKEGDSSWEMLAGLGVAYDVTNAWRIRGEYSHFRANLGNEVSSDTTLGSFGVSAAYMF